MSITNVLLQELDEELELQFVDHVASVPLSKIKEKLLSKSLHNAVWILLNGINNHFPSFQGLTLFETQNLLQDMAEKLQFVQHLYTRFLLLPKLKDITRVVNNSAFPEWGGNGQKHQSIHFVNKSKTRILVAEPPSFLTVYDSLASAVSHILGAPVTLPIGPLLVCPDGSEKEALKILKIGPEIGSSKKGGKYNVSLGKELLPQDALRVQFLPLRPFYSGEIVAWKTGKEGEKLRYGRVPEDVRPSEGQALYRLSVETAPGETLMLLSSQVFSFRSVSMADVSFVPDQPESSERGAGNTRSGLTLANTRSAEVTNHVSSNIFI